MHISFKKLLGILVLVIPVICMAEETASNEVKHDLSALDRRIEIERGTRFKSFVLTPHKPNYLLPITYNKKPNNAPVDIARDGELDNNEIKFQLSVKFPLAENLFGKKGSLQFAYTNLSFWQAYRIKGNPLSRILSIYDKPHHK